MFKLLNVFIVLVFQLSVKHYISTKKYMGFIPLVDFVAGFIAGCSQVIIGQPLDYIKTKMQVEEGRKTIIETSREIIAQHGLLGFYRGSSSIFMGIGGAIALQFSVYESAKRFCRRYLGIGIDDQLPIPQIGISGASVGLATSTLYCPIQYTKILLQTQKQSKYKGSAQAVWSIFWEKGPKPLYRGYLATLIRDVPGCWIYYASYESTLLSLSPVRQNASPWDYLVAGSSAGFSYWLYAFPFDRVKTKVQSGQNYKQVLSCLSLSKLYRGFGVVVMRCIPVNACSFLIYETVQKYLKKHNYLS